jgi:hypothetical protein
MNLGKLRKKKGKLQIWWEILGLFDKVMGGYFLLVLLVVASTHR